METSISFLFYLRHLLFLSILFIMTSCGGSGGGGSGDLAATSPTTTAINSVSNSITNIIASNADGVSGVGGDSAALLSLLSLIGITVVDNGDQGLTDDLIALIEDAMDPSTADVTSDGDVITIIPSAQQVCDNIAAELGFPQGGDDYNACLQVLAGIQVVITKTSDNSGVIEVSHEGSVFISLQYSPDELIITNNLASLFAALQSISAITDPTDVFDLPDTLAGETKLTVRTLGDDHGFIEFEVTQAIAVVDVGQGIDFSLQPSILFSIEANGPTGEATITGQLAAVNALFPVEVNENGDELPSSLTLAEGTELMLNVTDGGDAFDGLVTVGMLDFMIDGQNTFDFFLDPSFTQDASTGVVTFDTELIMNIGFNDTSDIFGIFGTLDVTAPAGTSFIELSGSNPFDAVYQVQSGSITFVGTGEFVSYTDTIVVDECFNFDGRAACMVATSCEDVSGVWNWTVSNIDSQFCGPESDWFDTVTLDQTVCSLIATGIDDSIGIVTGNVNGQTVTVGQFQHLDGDGITTSTFTMTVAPGGATMSGNESWTWLSNDGQQSCGLGTADITAVKQ